MAESGAESDFQIPDGILSVIPTDPYEQLDLARKITSLAIASRVSKLDSEAGGMRQKIADKDRLISELRTRISELESMFRELDARLRTSLEENIALLKERDSLLVASKKMNRDLAKMETFKRHLMQSLNDNTASAETVDIGTCDQSVPKTTSRKVNTGAAETCNKTEEGKKLITPRFTPRTTPKITSTSNSPKGLSTRASPKMISGATSPAKSHVEGYPSMSPWYPSSKQSSAANSPPRGRSLPGRAARVDGKEFFRQARSRLSYEQFAAFLANIKELNAHKQSREETLKKTEEIFGADNKDLYLSFQGLLGRNMP
ncbi:hypothetical protein KSP39_PZI009149 [Platanthera zijinensis]|uniref:At4g15545-like C-terminal domain-containing protein n=1 Tax=Platanthera zijinensis TaxID=2320716 RepID=A0AAP0G7A8_9ASPA